MESDEKETLVCGDYKYVDQLGQGTYGEVVQVSKGDQQYALKKYKSIKTALGIGRDVLSELNLLQNLRYKNVLQADSVFYDDTDNLCVVLPIYMTDLSKAIPTLKLDVKHKVIKNILCGLICMHYSRVAHLDIKPANILYNSPDDVVISDFGMSMIMMKDKRLFEQLKGTYGWNPPETLSPSKGTKQGFKDDIWATGLVILQIMSNNRNYLLSENRGAQYKLMMMTFGDPKKKEDILSHWISDPQLYDLASKMLEIDDTKRITSSGILSHPYMERSKCRAELQSSYPVKEFSNYHTTAKEDSLKKMWNVVSKYDGADDIFIISAYILDKLHSLSEDKKESDKTSYICAAFTIASKICGYNINYYRIFRDSFPGQVSDESITNAQEDICKKLNYRFSLFSYMPKLRDEKKNNLALVDKIIKTGYNLFDLAEEEYTRNHPGRGSSFNMGSENLPEDDDIDVVSSSIRRSSSNRDEEIERRHRTFKEEEKKGSRSRSRRLRDSVKTDKSDKTEKLEDE